MELTIKAKRGERANKLEKIMENKIVEKTKTINRFYLDKEKDIIVNLYKISEDELTYILETPNHGTGNLITNLAKICGLKTIKNEKDMKIIEGKIPASLNGDNEEVYIFRLGG